MAGTHTTSRPASFADETTSDSGASKVGELASKGKDAVTEKGSELTQTAKSKAVEKADERKSFATDKARSVHGDLKDLTSSVREKQPQVADALETVLDRAEGFIDYVEKTPVDEMTRSLQTQLRQRPVLAIGGMFAAGFLLARAMKPVDGVVEHVKHSGGNSSSMGSLPPATLGTPRGTVSGQLPQSTGTPVHV